jgi:hypothetical protein
MQSSDFVLVRGIADTRATLSAWNGRPGPVIWRWLRASLAISLGLLVAVWLVALASTPDPSASFLGLSSHPDLGQVRHVVWRNSLVLALHAMACVAGFIAGSSLPLEAEQRNGVWRWVHEKAGPLAIAFVIGATTFSLVTQAFVLGNGTASLAAKLDVGPGLLLIGLLPHALPELVALFLPLAAWILASRQKDWHELLAATVVTVLLAAPVLVAAAFVEVYVSPSVLRWLAAG